MTKVRRNCDRMTVMTVNGTGPLMNPCFEHEVNLNGTVNLLNLNHIIT